MNEPPQPGQAKARPQPLDRLTDPRVFAALLLALGAGLSFWYASRGLPFQDEGATLTGAAKILRGGVFYHDIDAYPFPGAPYLLAFFMSIFGEQLSVARALAGIAWCASLLSLYAVALQLLDRQRAALFGLALLGFKFLAWPGFSVYLYSDLAFAFACIAMALVASPAGSRASLRLVGAGACVAAAVLCKQNLGLYLGAVITALLAAPALLRQLSSSREVSSWKPLLSFVVGGAVPLGVVATYFASEGLLGSFLYSGLIRPLTGYLPTSAIPFAPMLAWWQLGQIQGAAAATYFPTDLLQMLQLERLPGQGLYPAYWLAGEILCRAVYSAVPIAYLWLAWRWLAARRGDEADGPDPQLLGFGWMSLAVVASAFPRADFFHVICVFPPVLLLLFALARDRGAMRSPPARGTAPRALAVGVAIALMAFGSLALLHRSQLSHRVQLERADVYVEPSQAWMETLVRVVSRELGPDDPFFVYGHESQLYFLTGRFFPWPFSQLYPGMVGRDGGQTIADMLATNPPRYIFQGIIDWPGLPAIPEYAPVLAEEIGRSYGHDTRFFERHGLPPGVESPPSWIAAALQPRAILLAPQRRAR